MLFSEVEQPDSIEIKIRVAEKDARNFLFRDILTIVQELQRMQISFITNY